MPIKNTANLQDIQSLMAQAIMRPLDATTQEIAAELIKPNQVLNSFGRLEIYNKQYWMRVLESLEEDFPGLKAILGTERFEALSVAYLTRYPSTSYTLNNLGKHLAAFIHEQPSLTYPDIELAYEMACFEWAEIMAYDAQSYSPLKAESLRGLAASNIVLQLQPHITLLELNYALDNFLARLDNRAPKSVESNAVLLRIKKSQKISKPKKQHIFIAVHRLNNAVYHKRLNGDQFFLLKALASGQTLGHACQEFVEQKATEQSADNLEQKFSQYFSTWMELNWFCDQGTIAKPRTLIT